MKITQRSVAAWTMALCHSCDVNVESPKAVKGVYALVLRAEQERLEHPTASKYTKIDNAWCDWMGNKMAEYAGNDTDRKITDNHRENMRKHARRALTTTRRAKDYQLALKMAVALDLIPPISGHEVELT